MCDVFLALASLPAAFLALLYYLPVLLEEDSLLELQIVVVEAATVLLQWSLSKMVTV